MLFKIFFSAFALSVLFSSCNSNNSSSNFNVTEETPIAHVEPATVEIRGKTAFEQKCAPCHGSDGTAGIGNAANLQLSKLDRVSVSKIIAEGRGGMPSFTSQLTKEEIADISNYILTLHK